MFLIEIHDSAGVSAVDSFFEDFYVEYSVYISSERCGEPESVVVKTARIKAEDEVGGFNFVFKLFEEVHVVWGA